MFLQLAGVDVDRATLKKRRVTAATPSGFSWSIRRNGIDAIHNSGRLLDASRP